MGQNFISCDPGQGMLLPPSLTDWLAEDHLVWTVLGAVEQMDLDGFYGAYRANGQGRAAYDPQMMGRIQPVVATLNVEELRCPEGTLLSIELPQRGRAAWDVRRLGAGNTGSGSGRRSLEEHPAKTLRWRRACCRALVSGGSARVAGCRPSPSRRCLGATCPSPSGRRSRSCSLVVVGCGRSRASWGGRRRRSPESCSGTHAPDRPA